MAIVPFCRSSAVLPPPLLPRGIINEILEKFLTVLFRNPVYGNGNPGEWIKRRRKKERGRKGEKEEMQALITTVTNVVPSCSFLIVDLFCAKLERL